jgi:hypothetical protein
MSAIGMRTVSSSAYLACSPAMAMVDIRRPSFRSLRYR